MMACWPINKQLFSLDCVLEGSSVAINGTLLATPSQLAFALSKLEHQWGEPVALGK